MTRETTAADIAAAGTEAMDPVFGPVFVEGAEPGDALAVSILDLTIADWGWSGELPRLRPAGRRVHRSRLHVWELDAAGLTPAAYGPGGRVPLRPFPGILGVAPADAGVHAVISPRRVGGNLDTRDLVVGSTLYLPVEVPGALFSCGDGHASQGDGEVCGTAIETAMTITVGLDVVKGAGLRGPRFTVPAPSDRHHDERATTSPWASRPTSWRPRAHAAREMVAFISETHGMTPVEAYMLCSVCADLRISEVVDAPNWVVSMYFPRVVFES